MNNLDRLIKFAFFSAIGRGLGSAGLLSGKMLSPLSGLVLPGAAIGYSVLANAPYINPMLRQKGVGFQLPTLVPDPIIASLGQSRGASAEGVKNQYVTRNALSEIVPDTKVLNRVIR